MVAQIRLEFFRDSGISDLASIVQHFLVVLASEARVIYPINILILLKCQESVTKFEK
jgi:hypothetical protein